LFESCLAFEKLPFQSAVFATPFVGDNAFVFVGFQRDVTTTSDVTQW